MEKKNIFLLKKRRKKRGKGATKGKQKTQRKGKTYNNGNKKKQSYAKHF